MKKIIATTLLGAVALIASSVTTVSAQETKAEKPVHPEVQTVLKQHDTNKDGKLDESELAAWQGEKKAKTILKKYDANQDGKLDESELAEWLSDKKHKEKTVPSK